MIDAFTLRQRLTALEAQLAEQTGLRDKAAREAQSATNAMLQLQGAIAVVRDLLTPELTPEPEEKAS